MNHSVSITPSEAEALVFIGNGAARLAAAPFQSQPWISLSATLLVMRLYLSRRSVLDFAP
jgi:hypothetical protein